MNYCIYFLLNKNKVVYIGLTRNLDLRLEHHRSGGKKFNSYRAITVLNFKVGNAYEKRWIRKFKPLYNVQGIKPIEKLNNHGLYIRIESSLKERVNQYVAEKKPIGGLSGLVKRFLLRKVSK